MATEDTPRRCPARLRVRIEPKMNLATQEIESGEAVYRCLLLEGHSGNHVADVPSEGGFRWFR